MAVNLYGMNCCVIAYGISLRMKILVGYIRYRVYPAMFVPDSGLYIRSAIVAYQSSIYFANAIASSCLQERLTGSSSSPISTEFPCKDCTYFRFTR